MIRTATQADVAAIAAVWNDVIRSTDVTFTTVEKSEGDVLERMQRTPLLVAEIDGRFAGFATYGTFRSGPGYTHVAEHSLYVAAWAQRCGIGRDLMSALEKAASARGIEILVAGISGSNPAAQAFHARLGFEEVGRLPGVGQKWGRSLDLVLMQKNLFPRHDLRDRNG